MKKRWDQARGAFGLWRAYRLVAPYEGYTGQGYWLKWLAVPRYIVDCETNGYYGDSKWLAANPSGANGPAQLLGWGQPFPADTDAERLEYWRITHDLYESSGSSPWACA